MSDDSSKRGIVPITPLTEADTVPVGAGAVCWWVIIVILIVLMFVLFGLQMYYSGEQDYYQEDINRSREYRTNAKFLLYGACIAFIIIILMLIFKDRFLNGNSEDTK